MDHDFGRVLCTISCVQGFFEGGAERDRSDCYEDCDQHGCDGQFEVCESGEAMSYNARSASPLDFALYSEACGCSLRHAVHSDSSSVYDQWSEGDSPYPMSGKSNIDFNVSRGCQSSMPQGCDNAVQPCRSLTASRLWQLTCELWQLEVRHESRNNPEELPERTTSGPSHQRQWPSPGSASSPGLFGFAT